MKKILLSVILLYSCILSFGTKPHIIVIATGGTIAGTAESTTKAGYSPAQITVESLLSSVPQLKDKAEITGMQLCNISSQAMNHKIWIRLATVVDSLCRNNLCDGIVVTHGTDTMEETAYFLQLVIPYKTPIVLVGAMRPSTSLSADGPMNLYNAVSLASNSQAVGKGVMIIMNDYILSADDATKTNTVNPNSFECPNYGPLGSIRGGKPFFFREPKGRHNEQSRFSIEKLKEYLITQSELNTSKLNHIQPEEIKLPQVEIILSYANASAIQFEALLKHGVDGIIISGVGHGNYSPAIAKAIIKATPSAIKSNHNPINNVVIVRSSRVLKGGVTTELEEPFEGQIASYYKTPQKARILLMLALTQTRNSEEIQSIFVEY
jgi:L-asparaginase